MRILVIGAVAAGTSAATKASRNDKTAEIVIYEKGTHISYIACDTPYYIGGVIENIEALAPRDPAFFKKTYGIDVKIRHEVLSIDPAAKTITVKDLEKGEIFVDNYDKLVIATGARSVVPPIRGVEQEHVFSLRTIQDALEIEAFISNKKPETAAIIGSGSIGMELCENFALRGLESHMIEMAPYIHPALDPEMAAYVEEHLKEHDVRLYSNTRAVAIAEDHVLTANGEKIPGDLVIVATGIRPEVTLAREAGIKLGDTGAIAVNEYLQTSDPDIYACGDCIETFNLVTQKPAYFPLGSTANKTGRIAGDVITGGDLSFRGVLGTGIFKVFDLHVAKTGLTEQQALEAGYNIEVAHIKRPHKLAETGGRDMILKAVADRDSEKILGAQIIGQGGVDKRIDVLVTAMTLGAKVGDLFHLDLAYSPLHSTVRDPVMYVGMVLDGAIKKAKISRQ
ncbi:MAG: FAD-dependent oxidoreductase [Eubacteriales bacterium]|nr:FAD-dependent oxidoreductase [Eubacteriales bacterium]